VDDLTDKELRKLLTAGPVRADREHVHRKRAKFLHPPSPTVRELHDHDVAYEGKPRMRASHVKDDHEGKDADGLHEYRHKDMSVKYATRLDGAVFAGSGPRDAVRGRDCSAGAP
jgi:hypothetical protein